MLYQKKCRPFLLVVFGQSVRDVECSWGSVRDLAQIPIKEAMDQVTQVFEGNGRHHPFQNKKSTNFEVDLLMKEHRSNEPPENRRCLSLYSSSRKCMVESKEKYLSVLFIVAFFFAIRSCEHLITPKQCKTTNINFKDTVFANQRGGIMKQRPKETFQTEVGSIVFREQKKRWKMGKINSRGNFRLIDDHSEDVSIHHVMRIVIQRFD